MAEEPSDQSLCSGGDDDFDRNHSSIREYMRTESGSAGLLVLVSVIALLWANSPWSDSYVDLWHTLISVEVGGHGISMDLHHWINDGVMVLFFFVIGLEVRREFAIGELTDRSRLVIPVVAGLGGMLVPALLYLLINSSGEAARGWGIVIGTDTAFLLGILALVGPSVSSQLRIFLLTLTVIDDIVAVSVIGVVYSDSLEVVPLIIAGLSLIGIAVLGRAGQWRAWPYVLLVVVLWVATLQSGLHASIAGMLSGLLVPAVSPSRGQVENAAVRFRAFRQSPMPDVQRAARRSLNKAISVNERLQEVLHTPTSYVVVPIFALANAGVDLRNGVLGDALTSPVTWGVVIGLVLGKLIGIGAGGLGAARLGWGTLPQGVGAGHVLAGGALSGIGFTVSLLIVGLAFTHPELQTQATVGVLLSAVLASLVGWLLFWVAARFFGQTDAALPTVLSDPIDLDRDHVRGPEDADLTLVEYLDYECPFCSRATGMADEVRAHFGDRLRYVVRHMPLEVHPHARLAALAAEAASRQGRFWDMHLALFEHQDHLELEDVIGYAERLDLDLERFMEDLESESTEQEVIRDMESANASGVRGTPTFFIGDHRHEGPHDARTLIDALERSGGRRSVSS